MKKSFSKSSLFVYCTHKNTRGFVFRLKILKKAHQPLTMSRLDTVHDEGAIRGRREALTGCCMLTG